MELNEYFKSIIDQDNCSVVICNLEHKIIYMNPAAVKKYKRRGGASLLGQNLLKCHKDKSCEKIIRIVEWFAESKENNRIHTFFNKKQNKDVYMVALRNSEGNLIGYYEKHEFRTREADTKVLCDG